MDKLKCRIISVNTDNKLDLKSVQIFGNYEDSNGNKIRYVQRRRKIFDFLSNFSSEEIDITCFDAVTPKDFNDNLDDHNMGGSIRFKGHKFELLNEMWTCHIGNFLSHYEIWNIDEDTLILEDDLIFDTNAFNNFISIVKDFLKIPQQNKILYLQKSIPWMEGALDKQFNLVPFTDSIGLYIGGDISGTSAYFITKECKKIILDNLIPISPCDNYLDRLLKNNLIQYYIPLDLNDMFQLDKNTNFI